MALPQLIYEARSKSKLEGVKWCLAKVQRVRPRQQDEGKQQLSPHMRRVAQYAALFLLREIKNEGVDDSQYIHALTYVDLTLEDFKDISQDKVAQLIDLNAALKWVVMQRTVSPSVMQRVLTDQQHIEYIHSFELDISHVESEDNNACGAYPAQLQEYLDNLRQGDKYTRISNMFRNARNLKRGKDGKTAFGRYEEKAESCYESAVLYLCNLVETDPLLNPVPNPKLASEIMRWLDRDVNPKTGFEPAICAAGVPRLLGVKSRFALSESQPIVGINLRKHWRQREALSKAVLQLLYDELEEDSSTEKSHDKTRLLSQKLRKLSTRVD